MKRFFRILAVLIPTGILVVVLPRAIPVHVYDGFESPHLSRMRWSSVRFEKGAVAVQEQVVRSGHRALAITVHSGDRYEAASNEGAATERAELMEAWWLFARRERPYVYSFSLYLPSDFSVKPERLVIAQWKQFCWKCHPDNPVLAIRYDAGRIKITRRDAQHSELLYEGDEDVRGRWLNFRFVIRFDFDDHGSIDATLDGKPIVHYRGPTVYRPFSGHLINGLVYFKTGLYRDALGEPPWTIYVDEYRKDECPVSGCQ